MAKGTIRRLMDRGFGFIKTGDEKGKGRDGRPEATKVRLA